MCAGQNPPPAGESGQRQIYLVVSQTGTCISSLLKIITGAEYNHVSVSLCEDLSAMYSFGRRHPYNPFWGGFVLESPRTGTFKRFPQTEAAVVRLEVTPDQYRGIQSCLAAMYQRRMEYRYNYLGLVLAGLRIRYRRRNRYYCSEFVKELLTRYEVIGDEETEPITQPIQFLYLKNGRMVYRGKLRCYNQTS